MNLKEEAARSIASQDKFELWQLLELLSCQVPTRILEIGVHRGGMIKTLHSVFPHAIIIGIDQDFSQLEFRDFIQVKGDSHNPEILDKAMDNLGRRKLDFLFIDGDHHYEGVKADYEMYSRYVRKGGIIAFHDIMRPAGLIDGVEVSSFWHELKQRQPTIELWGGPVNADSPHSSDAPGTGIIFA